jgi:Secretion system C-terminal sorting domain
MKTFITNSLSFLVLFFSISTNKLNAQCTTVTDYATLASCFSSGNTAITVVANITLTGNITLQNNVNYNLTINENFDIFKGLILNYTGGNGNTTITYIGTAGNTIINNNNGSGFTVVGLNAASSFKTYLFGPVLTVDLNDFKINKKSTENLLSWRTTKNKNIDKFVVEKSSNGINFIQIGNVKPDINELNEYSFADNTPLSINYYRLMILEKDGRTSYSKVLTASSNGSSKNLKVYPNPIGSDGYLYLETVNDIQNVSIINTLGQVVLTSNTSKINISQLTKGFYNVIVKSNNETMIEKFLKQ